MARENWGSRFGFIMATAGFSIGLGNIWRFPYLTGMNGGGAFLLVYLALALFIGIPLFTAEVSLGRKTQLTPIAGMERLTGSRRSPWNLIGWLGITAAFLIISYYFVIIGWVVAYIYKTGAGHFRGLDSAAIQSTYDGLVADPVLVLGCTALVSVIVGLTVSRGLRQGVELANKILMPLLFVSLLLLAIGSLTLPGAMEGLAWYLAPDFSKLTLASLLAALGQVFFSIGIGLAGAFVYGSYLKPRETDVPGGTAMVVAFDTMAAFTAGLVIFPAVFAFGLDPNSGPGLLFVTLTAVFAQAPAGNVVGAIFFFLVFVAGITSAIGLVEALVASAIDSLRVKRKPALWTILALSFVVGIPSALSFGPWSQVRWLGRDPFSFVDFISGSILLPVGGLLIAGYTAWVWGFKAFQHETNEGSGGIKVFSAWGPFIRFVIPIAVAVVLLRGLGAF